jgi:hypothetical protein
MVAFASTSSPHATVQRRLSTGLDTVALQQKRRFALSRQGRESYFLDLGWISPSILRGPLTLLQTACRRIPQRALKLAVIAERFLEEGFKGSHQRATPVKESAVSKKNRNRLFIEIAIF